MTGKTANNQNATQDDKCAKKHERPLSAPIIILNEFKSLLDFSNDSKVFKEFQTSCDKKMTWSALICPQNEPYNERAWKVEIEIPRDYPKSPPKMKLATPIYHPNVKDSGEVKLEMLEKKEWKDSVSMIDVVNALVDLIDNPNAEDEKLVLNEEAAKQLKDKADDFKKKAQEMAKKKALNRPPEPENEKKDEKEKKKKEKNGKNEKNEKNENDKKEENEEKKNSE